MGKARRRKTLWVVVAIVLVLVVAAVLAFVWLGHDGPDIPHGTSADRGACTSCHSPDRLPENHRERGDDTCLSCHSAKDTAGTLGGEAETASLVAE